MHVSDHPDFQNIVMRLRAGESPASVAKSSQPPLKPETLRSWWKRNKKSPGKAATGVTITGDLDDLDAELDRATEVARRAAERGLTVRSIAVEAGGSEWDGWERTGDEPATSATQTSARRKAKVVVDLPRGGQEAAPEIRQAEPVEIKLRMPRPPRRDKAGWRTAVVLPDEQYPYHDAAAIDVAEQLVAYVEQAEGVDDLVWLGDNVDAPELSKHRSAPEVLGATQSGIDGYYRHMARIRAITPEASLHWLLGNHEQRLTNYLVDIGATLVGLRRADDPEDEPVLSMEFLCRTKELGVEVHGPYPEGAVWLTSSFRLIHGTVTGPHPEDKYLAQMEASTIWGHTHRAVLAYREVDRGPRGLRSYAAGSPGCLCRLDGALPSAKSGVDSRGRAGRNHSETWQQGVMFVRYQEHELPRVELVRIHGGVAVFEGREFRARCDVDGNPV